MEHIVIVGGGAAGLMAAGTALSLGKKVVLIEKNQRPARKVMITGKGRCNVTNACTPDGFLEAVVSNRSFLNSAIRRFSPYDTMALFEQTLGVPLKVERGNRVFPVSDKAVDIVDGLTRYAKGAQLRTGLSCTGLHAQQGKITGLSLSDGSVLPASSVILAVGGASYPATGSTGDGYALAQSVGHSITPLIPSLVPLVCHTTDCRDLMGLSLKNVTLSVTDTHTERTVFRELGEMLFTHFGVSGPLVLSASAHMRPMEDGRYELSVDMKPGLAEAQLDARLLRDFQDNIHRTLRNSLGKLLPAKMIPVVIQRSRIPPDTKVNQVTKEQRQRLAEVIKHLTFRVNGFRPVEEAIVTAGGVSVREVDPKTMESKLIKGLYFAGELLDLDAYTGGYNLQIAFSTGYAAGFYAE